MPNFIKNNRRAAVAAFVSLATAGALYATVALAQTSGSITQTGPVVNVDGGGGDVKVLGARVSVDGATARVKAAGAVVEIRGAVEDGVWAAGADVSVTVQTGGSVRAAGAHVVVRGRMAGDMMAAGAVIDLDVATEGELKAAGANVRIGNFTDIAKDVSAAGANVVFDGRAKGNGNFAGAVVTINGEVAGAVTVHAERLIIGPQAVIGGGLLVRSLTEPTIDPGAKISGDIVRELPGKWFDDVPKGSPPVFAAAFAFAIFLFGLVFMIIARNTYGEAVDHVRLGPLSAALFGVITVIALLVLAAFLMATVVGIPLAIALLMLLPIIAVFGLPSAAAGIVGWVLGRKSARLGVGQLLLFLIVGALIIAFMGIVPFTGPWVVLVAMVIGSGAFLQALLWRFRQKRPVALRRTPEPTASAETSAPVE